MNGLLIGRFQPFHLGHLAALHFALSKVDNLWIGIGSSNKPPQKDNPFSADERKEMILSSVSESEKRKIRLFSIPDVDNHKKWIENIDSTVPPYDVVFTNDELTRHIYERNGTSVMAIPFKERDVLSGTNIRHRILNDQEWQNLVPDGTRKLLQKISAKERLKIL